MAIWQLVKAAKWYRRLQKLRLTSFNDTANKLLNICDLAPTATPEEFIEHLLDLDVLLMSYDVQTNKIINVDIISI